MSSRGRSVKLIVRAVAAIAGLYILWFGTVLTAMLQTPERFGQFMRHAPEALVWGSLPAPRMWLWARQGHLTTGQTAPDFTLHTVDRQSTVTLSSFRGRQPVVLVFGSYS